MTPFFLAALVATLLTPVVPAVVQTTPIRPAVAPPSMVLHIWTMAPASCEGIVQTATRPAMPQPVAAYDPISPYRLPATASALTLSFAIDSSGRPHAIRRDTGTPSYIPNVEDVLPALAVSRFAPGPARARCTVRFTQQPVPLAAAPIAAVYAATLPPLGRRIQPLFERIRPAGSTCTAPRPEPRLIAMPPFRSLPKTPGQSNWTIVRFDVAANGKPVAVAPVGTSGDTALNRAAVKAVADSHFAPAMRTGCLRPFVQAAGTLSAPDTPPDVKTPPAGATCPETLAWATPPVLRFPENYRRRAIEGWAAVAYDVATWGEIGNIRVLAAEPSADFGDAASRMLLAARNAPSPAGYSGCTVVVRYRIGNGGMTPSKTASPSPDENFILSEGN